MKPLIIWYMGLTAIVAQLHAVNFPDPGPNGFESERADSLPAVLNNNHSDLLESRLRREAALKFPLHQLPGTKQEWEKYRGKLKHEIIRKTGALIAQKLPLNMKETGAVKMKGYTVKNIAFQSRPGVYATANLFVPDGQGPFPATIVMMGHSNNGRLYDTYQAISHILALNGYVSLSIDPWGAGERTTSHGIYEYHGANLGASLMNIGETLMGVQITDNIRGVDLLASLPYVDPQNIGATGTSGGGNQTMWLAALDNRIKAAVPVTSVGSFESYIMESNCICETLVDGLNFTEEAGVLALVAPRALALYNGLKESNPAFYPSEMLRSYTHAKPVFELYGVGDHLNNRVFDLPHGYNPEMREAMIGWFNLHLKGEGKGEPVEDLPFELLMEEELMTFAKGKRKEDGIFSTESFCKQKGGELRSAFLNKSSFFPDQKRQELRDILRINERSTLKKEHVYSNMNGWDRLALETSDEKLIPLLHLSPSNGAQEYVIVCDPKGKGNIPISRLEDIRKNGSGLVIVDLSGTGEASSVADTSMVRLAQFHTLSRARLWLGRTMLGEWAKELDLVTNYLYERFHAEKVYLDGTGEAGLAGMFLMATGGKMDGLTLRKAPISYLFDDRKYIDHFSMGIHLPGFLQWGDISLAAALGGKDIKFIDPVTMSGQKISENKLKEYEAEYEKIKEMSTKTGKTTFIDQAKQLDNEK